MKGKYIDHLSYFTEVNKAKPTLPKLIFYQY